MKIEAYAKVNLTLEVLGKRPDGYHEIRSVVLPITLSDTLEIEPTTDGVVTSDTGYDNDLCVKAALALRREKGLGARIHVTKRIPVGGGLGGGSADAAAVLVALNDLWSTGLTTEELAAIGARVGSDVPSLVYRRPVVMEGRGECITPLGTACPELDLVLVDPGVHSSTAEVYAACQDRRREGPSPTARMADALTSGEGDDIPRLFMNDLQAPAVALHREIGDVLAALRSAGVANACMSGSGACVFGAVRGRAEAERLAGAMASAGYRAWAIKSASEWLPRQDSNLN